MLTWFSGLRGLAALIVVLYHLNQNRTTVWLSSWSWSMYQFTEHLVFVVSIFFILSGLLRSLSYWKKMEKWESVPQFFSSLKERLRRIAPAYYLSLILSLVVVWIFSGITTLDIVRFFSGIFFLNWLHPTLFFPVDHNWPLWFITYEMLGWIGVSLFMMLLSRLPRSAIIASFVWASILLFAWHFIWISLPWSSSSWVVGEWFPTYNPFLFGLHFLLWAWIGYIITLMRRYKKRKHIIFDILFLIAAGYLIYFVWDIRGADDWAYSWPIWPYHFPLVPGLLWLIIFALPFSRYIWRLLDNRILVFYGQISYALYLFHAIVIVLLRHYVFTWIQLDLDIWFLFSFIVICVSTLIAYSVTRWFEPIWQKK